VLQRGSIERFAVDLDSGALGNTPLPSQVLQRVLLVLLVHGPFVHLCYERFAHIYYSLSTNQTELNLNTGSLSSPKYYTTILGVVL
jgi:hypothetical protein